MIFKLQCINWPPSSIAAIIKIFSDGSNQQLSQNFALKCVVTVSYNVDGLDIMWKDPNNTIMEFDRFGALEAGCNVSTVLVFELLSPLNDGVFVCEANLSDFRFTDSFEVSGMCH